MENVVICDDECDDDDDDDAEPYKPLDVAVLAPLSGKLLMIPFLTK